MSLGNAWTAVGWPIVILLIWVVPVYVAHRVGQGRFSWLWGMMFGWFGVLGVWLYWRQGGPAPPVPDEYGHKECPNCGAFSADDATYCRKCREPLPV